MESDSGEEVTLVLFINYQDAYFWSSTFVNKCAVDDICSTSHELLLRGRSVRDSEIQSSHHDLRFQILVLLLRHFRPSFPSLSIIPMNADNNLSKSLLGQAPVQEQMFPSQQDNTKSSSTSEGSGSGSGMASGVGTGGATMNLHPRVMWTPKNVSETRMDAFRRAVNSQHKLDLSTFLYLFWRWRSLSIHIITHHMVRCGLVYGGKLWWCV